MTNIERVDLEAGLSYEQIEAIEDQQMAASVIVSEGRSKYPGMTYEQGIRDALEWVLGESDEMPLEGE